MTTEINSPIATNEPLINVPNTISFGINRHASSAPTKKKLKITGIKQASTGIPFTFLSFNTHVQ